MTETSTNLIVVDVGNSSAKLARYQVPSHGDQELRQRLWLERVETFGQLERLTWGDTARWLVGSVAPEREAALREWVARHRPQDQYRLVTYRQLPIRIDVSAPERTGIDRLAAATAANQLRDASSSAIVIDAGTAITVDLVTANGVFQGGAILPGISMAAATLSRYAAALPLVEINPDDNAAAVGKSTADAITSGVQWGTLGAVRELIQRLHADQTEANVFFTGGTGRFLADSLGYGQRYVDDLVLRGIATVHFEGAVSRQP